MNHAALYTAVAGAQYETQGRSPYKRLPTPVHVQRQALSTTSAGASRNGSGISAAIIPRWRSHDPFSSMTAKLPAAFLSPRAIRVMQRMSFVAGSGACLSQFGVASFRVLSFAVPACGRYECTECANATNGSGRMRLIAHSSTICSSVSESPSPKISIGA